MFFNTASEEKPEGKTLGTESTGDDLDEVGNRYDPCCCTHYLRTSMTKSSVLMRQCEKRNDDQLLGT